MKKVRSTSSLDKIFIIYLPPQGFFEAFFT